MSEEQPNPEEIKELVLSEIAKTHQRIGEYKELTKPISPDAAYGRISRMDAINNKSVAEAALRQAEIKLSFLDLVMKKIGTAEFGKCMNCGNVIPLKRILIRPESVHCVGCSK